MYIVKMNVSRINGKGETKRVNVQVLADTLIINEAVQPRGVIAFFYLTKPLNLIPLYYN